MNNKSFERIILVADNTPGEGAPDDLFNRDSDKAQSENVTALFKALKVISKEVILYDSLEKFTHNTASHINDLVFPYWHGERSRNKQALVASVCEAAGIKYIGADTYTNIVCCDKVLAKEICRMSGLLVPQSITIRKPIKSRDLPTLRYPILVKPNYEGSSIGITQDNIFWKEDPDRLQDMVNNLYNNLGVPILIEEFIAGKEVSISIVGWRDNIKAWGAVERYSEENKQYFETFLHSHEDKINNTILLRDAKNLLDNATMINVFNLFDALDKVEYIRIDGKMTADGFYCFELSHDTTLDPEGAFFKALSFSGCNYQNAVNLIIANCLERYSSLYPNQ